MSTHWLSTTFLVLLFFLLYQLFLIFAPFLTNILWALLLARLFYPVYDRLKDGLRGKATVAAMFTTLFVMLVAVLPVAYLVILALTETLHAYQKTMAWVQGGGLQQLPQTLGRVPFIGTFSQELLGRFILAYGDLQNSVIEGGKAVSGLVLTRLGGLAQNIVELVTDFLIILFTLFFLFRDGRRLYATIYAALPIEDAHKAVIFSRLDNTVVAVVRGTLLTALAQGTVAGVTYWLLGLSFPVFLGALSAMLALLPFGGTALVWIPVAAYLLWKGLVLKAVVMIIVGGTLVGLMDNILQPLLVGSAADLPVILLFFASIGGLAYFGFIGLFLGPIILGLTLAAFQIYLEQYVPIVVASTGSVHEGSDVEREDSP